MQSCAHSLKEYSSCLCYVYKHLRLRLCQTQCYIHAMAVYCRRCSWHCCKICSFFFYFVPSLSALLFDSHNFFLNCFVCFIKQNANNLQSLQLTKAIRFDSSDRGVVEEYFNECVCAVSIYYLHHLFYHSYLDLDFLWDALHLNPKQNIPLARIFYYAVKSHSFTQSFDPHLIRLCERRKKNTIETIAIIQRFRCTLNVFYRLELIHTNT